MAEHASQLRRRRALPPFLCSWVESVSSSHRPFFALLHSLFLLVQLQFLFLSSAQHFPGVCAFPV